MESPFAQNTMTYRVEETISYTSSHSVFKIKTKEGDFQILKIFNKTNLESESSIENFVIRLRTVKKLDHPNLVRIIDIMETDSCFYVFSEYCSNGNAAELIKFSPLSGREVFRIMKQIISAVRYLHSQGIPHTHLTLENIVFDSKMSPRLINYGYLTSTSSSAYNYSNAFDPDLKFLYLQKFGNEINYISPEELTGTAKDVFAVDIWHLGICIYKISTRTFPFYDRSVKKVIYNILNENPKMEKFSYQLRHCIEQCLVKNPENRAKANNLVSENEKQDYLSISSTKGGKTVINMPLSVSGMPYRPKQNSPVNRSNITSYEASVDPISISLIQRNYSQQFMQLQENEQNKDKKRLQKTAITPQFSEPFPYHHRHKSITPVIPKPQNATPVKPTSSSLFPVRAKAMSPKSNLFTSFDY